jgi:hypothetical protein
MRKAAFVLAVLGASAPAFGQGNVDQAKMLFSAGAKAYESGQFNAAIQAFEEANRLVPKPQIVFSIAQAERRQYFLDKDPDKLRAAIKRYHEYVDAVKEGGRIADAAQALAELEPIAAKLDTGGGGGARPTAKDPARVMVMTQVDDAAIAIDGKPAKSGMAMDVTPGRHHVSISATGYFPDERDVTAVQSALVPVDVQLREKPAQLVVTGLSGAQIAIDGRPSGTTPLTNPIEVPAGAHLVSVTKNGYRAYSHEVDVTRDEKKRIAVNLESTTQRTISYALMLGGGAMVIAGGIFTGAALKNQKDAQKILDRQTSGTISPSDAASYDDSRNRRDDWTRASIIAYAAGGVTIAAGLVLFLFDQPVVEMPAGRFEQKPKAPENKPLREPTEVRLLPVLGPGYAGLSGRF